MGRMKITVAQPVRVTSATGDVVLAPGTHEAKNAAEAVAFDLLVAQGLAEVATKKASASPKEG